MIKIVIIKMIKIIKKILMILIKINIKSYDNNYINDNENN